MIDASKRRSLRDAVRYKFGIQIPRNYEEAKKLDEENGTTMWRDAIALEMAQLEAYRTFRSLGLNAPIPTDHTEIPVRLVFDAKASGKRKARLVAGGHKTPIPDESVYSSVATLRSLRIVTLIAETNGLKLMAGDIGNAYLGSYTKEKVAFVAGPEFGELEGHTLIIVKALYGLRSSGLRYHEKFASTMRALGFFPSHADPDVWMRDAGDCYEYLVVYVDDLVAAMKDPKAFYDALQSDPWNYKLKGVEEPKYHLGADFFRDRDGTLCYGAQTYVKRLLKNFELHFGEQPRPAHSPLDEDDHPELDTSPLCGPDATAKYQSVIGACQWMISLCRFDIAQAVMTLSRFRTNPREGHVERLKRIVGY